jgi:hypothetical protein
MQAIRPLLLGAKDVAAAAPPLREIIDIIEATYRMEAEGKADVPPKFGVHPGRSAAFLHAMPAWVSGAAALGMKWDSYFPGNLALGVPDSSSIILLNDPETGLPRQPRHDARMVSVSPGSRGWARCRLRHGVSLRSVGGAKLRAAAVVKSRGLALHCDKSRPALALERKSCRTSIP